MKLTGIYQIQSKVHSERIYIGSAVDIDDRWRCHLKDLKKDKHHARKLQRHYSKYNESDLYFTILCTCEKEQLIQFEQYFLDFYRPYFNSSPTAGNCLGVKHTDTTRKNMSNSHIGNTNAVGHIVSAESKEIMSRKNKGKVPWMDGKTHTIEVRNKIGLKGLGRVSHNKKIILQFDKRNNFIKEWESITKAARYLGIRMINVSACLRGKSKTSGGFIWRYKLDKKIA